MINQSKYIENCFSETPEVVMNSSISSVKSLSLNEIMDLLSIDDLTILQVISRHHKLPDFKNKSQEERTQIINAFSVEIEQEFLHPEKEERVVAQEIKKI